MIIPVPDVILSPFVPVGSICEPSEAVYISGHIYGDHFAPLVNGMKLWKSDRFHINQ